MTECIVCNGHLSEGCVDYYDDRFGYPGSFRMRTCSACGHRTLAAEFSPASLTRLYSEYYPRSSFSLEDFRPAPRCDGFTAWLDGAKRSAYCWVPERVRVLDIGCGFGEKLAYHKSRGCEVHGVDADDNIRRVAEKFGFNAQAGLFDPRNYQPDYFDYVTLDQVIEHVADPLETLRGVALILKPGGVAILSTPNADGWGARLFGRRWINWHAPYHLQHFSTGSMKLAAEKAGFKMSSHRTLTCSAWLLYQWIHLLTAPRMGKPSPFWSPKGRQRLPLRIALFALNQLHRAKVNHLATRLFDLLGCGDNHLFFLEKRR